MHTSLLLLKKYTFVFCLILMLWGGSVFGQVNMTTTGTYTQDFNTLKTSGTAAWSDNSTITNWYAASYNSSYAAEAGTGNSGGLKSYGTGTADERALGSLGSGSATPAYGMVLRNTSGATITDIKVTYTGEQWRNGGNEAVQILSFYYATSTIAITSVTAGATGYTAVPALNFESKVNTATAAALNGNAAANRTVFTNVAIPSLSLANNDYIIIKWDDINDSGNDHMLSIDDLTITWTATADTTPPTVTTLSPTDNATDVAVASNFVLTFNENITKGTGDILIKRVSDDTVSETVAVSNGSKVIVSANTVTINPLFNLVNSTAYYIEIPDMALKDATGNFYAGISGNSTWNFTTIPLPPPVIAVSDNGTQVAAGNVLQGTLDHALSAFRLDITASNATLTGATISFAGTYINADIGTLGLKIKYNSTNDPTSATELKSVASTSTGSGETILFTGFSQLLGMGTKYFWITASLNPTAVAGRTIRALGISSTNLTFSSGTSSGTVSAGGSQTVTSAGKVSKTSGDWNVATTWNPEVVPLPSEDVTILATHLVTVTTPVTRDAGTTTTVNANGNLALNNSYINSGTTNVIGNLRMDVNGTANGGNNFIYDPTGNLLFMTNAVYTVGPFDNYWPENFGPNNVTVQANANISLDTGQNRVINGLALSGNISFPAASLTINGTCAVQQTGIFNHSPIYGSFSNLEYLGSGTYGRGPEWLTGIGIIATTPGYPNRINVTNGTILNLPNGSSGIFATNSTITIDLGGSLRQDFGGQSAGLSAGSSVTINGTLALGTNSGDDLEIRSGNLRLGASGSLINNNRAVFFKGDGNQKITRTGGGDVTFDYVVVDKNAGDVIFDSVPATNVIISGSAPLGRALEIKSTGTLDLNNRSLTFNNNGSGIYVHNPGTFLKASAPGATLIINGAKKVFGNVGATLIIDTNITTKVKDAFDFGNNMTTINGKLIVNANGYAQNSSAPIYAVNSTLQFETGGDFNLHNGSENGGWFRSTQSTGNPQWGIPWNLVVTGSTSLHYDSANNDNNPRYINGNLTIDSGSTFTLGGISGSTAGDFYLRGNFTNSGTFSPNVRLVTFDGSTNQTISGATTFDHLTIDNPAGVRLTSAITNNLTLNFLDGKITLENSNLTIGSSGTIMGHGSSKYVVTNGNGQLKRTVGPSSVDFPIGSSSVYNPISATNTGTSSVYGFRVVGDVATVSDLSYHVNKSWYVSGGVSGTSALRIIPSWSTADQGANFGGTGNYFIERYNPPSAVLQSPAALSGANPFSATLSNGSTSFSNAFDGTQYFAVSKERLSILSDIVIDGTFSYLSNIDYKNSVNTDITAANSVELARFTIRDGGGIADADTFATTLSSLTLNVGNFANLERLAIYDGTTEVAEVAAAGTTIFPTLSLSAPDNGEKSFTIRASFKSTVTDNQQLTLNITAATADVAGSGFAATNAGGAISSTTGDINRIEVIADRLAFVQQPSDTAVNIAMTPAVTVSANDINGNWDLDFTDAIDIISNGTLSTSPNSSSAVSGLANFTAITHTAPATSRTLTAAFSGLTNATSSSFNITLVSSASNFFRSRQTGNWSDASSWESSADGIAWINPATLAPTAAATSIEISATHTITTTSTTTAKDLTVKNGGTLQLNNQITNNGIFKIENYGAVNVNYTIADLSNNLWNGTENFEPESVVKFQALDNSAYLFTITSGTPVITARTYDGYNALFGQLILEASNGWSSFLPSGANYNLTHKDLYINFTALANFSLFSGNAITMGIGRDFIVNTNTSSFHVTYQTGLGNSILNVKRNFVKNGLGTGEFRFNSFATSSANNMTFNIDGDFIINSGVVNIVQGVSGGSAFTLNLKGNLNVFSGRLYNSNTSSFAACSFNFVGSSEQTINYVPNTSLSYLFMYIKSGAQVRLINQDFTLGSNSKVTVENGGTLDFGFNGATALNIKGNGTTGTGFKADAGSYLKITSPQGVSATSGTVGNVQTNTAPVYTQPLTYHYIGKENQITGTGIGSTSSGKAIIVELANNNLQLNLSQSFGITNATNSNINSGLGGILDIRMGKLIEDATNYITGSTGGLSMADGTSYSIAANSSSSTDVIPRLDGISNTYSLLGSSVIELSGDNGTNAFDQYLRASRPYRNLTFSNAGTKTISNGIPTLPGTILVSDAAVLDVADNSLGGSDTNLTMTGTSEYRTAGVGVKPDAGGTYSLGTGTKITFTNGSESLPVTTLQQIRLAPNYYNIDIEGNNVGTDTESGIKIQTGGTFSVKPSGVFKFTNSAGFSGVVGAAISPTTNPTIQLDFLSTVEYAGTTQTITSLTGLVMYENLRISGLSGVKTLGANVVEVKSQLFVDSSLLEIEANKTLIVRDNITTVNTTDTEGIIIKNNGSLVQVNDVDNATSNLNMGNIKMERITQPMLQLDYTYWSSPIFESGNEIFDSEPTLGEFKFSDLSPSSPFSKFFKWNPSATTLSGWVSVPPATSSMVPGRGYIVRAPSDFSNSSAQPYTANFVGRPNNGTINTEVVGAADPDPIPANTYYNWNLLGNPYPSAIDAEKFLDANSDGSTNNILGGTLYFWTHNSPAGSVSGPTTYNPNDYAAWNSSGGVGTGGSGDNAPTEPNITDNTPTGKIAAGQGFFVKGLANGNAVFNNSMRITGMNNQFFKSATSEFAENTTDPEKHRVWLNLTGATQGFNQTLVGYIQNATNSYDNRFDGESFGGNAVTLYSVLDNRNLVIQGRTLPFVDTDTVPLGYQTTLTGNLTLSIDHVDGLMETQNIYIQDNVLNIVHDLKESNYTFATVPGTFNSRFVLRYTPQENLSNPSFNDQLKSVTIYKNNVNLYVNSPYETIATVTVFDIAGRIIFEQKDCNTNRFETDKLPAAQQVLIVKVTLENGGVVTKKVTH